MRQESRVSGEVRVDSTDEGYLYRRYTGFRIHWNFTNGDFRDDVGVFEMLPVSKFCGYHGSKMKNYFTTAFAFFYTGQHSIITGRVRILYSTCIENARNWGCYYVIFI